MMAAEPLTREQILSAAEEALRRYGPAKTTVVDVAQSLGVSHGSVYRHFPTKAALRAAVVQQGLEKKAGQLRPIADESGPAADRLHRWLLALVEYKHGLARLDPELFGTYAMIEKDDSEVIREHVSVLTSQIARILRDGVESGEFRAPVLDGGAMAIWDATTRFHHPAHRHEWTDPKIGEQFERVWRLLLDGLAKG
ncbi:TetR family transcriptional regulator [Actinospica sp.]|jgi:AcrR family transcriptional regulator|uniref:TetR family transcriptional regulator n=1 Tax=Actinospica sp. TaxID=1872142 RepID=UPI002CC6BD7A|nr:TetR family transcriptional regulator [Actinospica sp.]HWG25737.1 TetR family transcriptional regulator [Actinospica sp.]